MKPRKLFRISLFRLLVLFTLAGIVLALVGKRYVRSMKQKEAVAALRIIDLPMAPSSSQLSKQYLFDYATATIVYDFEEQLFQADPSLFLHAPLGRPGPITPKPTPHQWSKWFGVDFMHDVVLVKFNQAATAQDIAHLRHLQGLKTVEFNGLADKAAWDGLIDCRQAQALKIYCYRSDNGNLPSLAKFDRLSKLILTVNTLTGSDFINLSKAKSLETVWMQKINLEGLDLESVSTMPTVRSFSASFESVDDCAVLEKMPNLRKAVLHGNFPVDKQTFESIGQLTHLEKLVILKDGPTFQRFRYVQPLARFLDGNPTANEVVLKPMAKLKNLKHLELHLHELSDADMEFVAMLPNLEYLSISYSGIGNRGMDWLKHLPKLKTLVVGTTKITRSGLEGFRLGNPECKIEWE